MEKIKKKILSFVVLIILVFLPILLSINTSLFTFYPSKYNEQSNDTFTKLKNSQTNIVWERVNGTYFERSYYNDIWGDGTYWYTCGANDSSSTYWDLLLTKWDSNGEVKWSETYAGDGGYTTEQGTGVWGDGTYIYTCGLTNKDEMVSGYDMVINKWYPNGTNIWSNTWGGLGYDATSCIWGFPGQYLFTCGHTRTGDADASIVQWDIETGNYVYDLTWGDPTSDDVCYSMTGDYPDIYLCGRGNSDLFLKKLVLGVGWDWETSWNGDYDDGGVDIWLDGNNIYTSGFTESGSGEKDLLLVGWLEEGGGVKELWNRTWGGALDDQAYSLWGYDNYLYTTGYTYSYDDDLLLLKWDKHGNLIWNSTWGDDEYPHGPAYGTGIMGDANYIYTCGHVVIDLGPQYGQRRALIKWDANPEQLDINLIWPPANSVYEGTVQVNIDIDKEFVFLDSVTYYWDDGGDNPIDWFEPYYTNLPGTQGSHTLYVNASTSTPYISDLDSFTFIRDDDPPSIEILSPTTNEIWDQAPAYDLAITEDHIAERWYTLNDGPNHYFYSDAGEIDDSAWNALPDGDVTIKFSVSDTMGHIGNNTVVVRKDTQAEQREFDKMIRNAIIGVLISAGGGGAIGLGYFLIKRRIKKRDEKLKSEKTS